ncbi:MAG: Asp-tRNA(Asn)/Glu-tRNA(Gln) amidotransferase subunit GatA [Planctomycetota bacterium]
MSGGTMRDVVELRDALRRGDLSAEEAVRDALRQIREADRVLRAVTETFEEEALLRAAEIDRRRARGEDAGPLAGVPFTAKDNLATRFGTTSAASRILRGYRAPYGATAVERLLAAGAICVAKTNMDEFGMGSSTENSSLGPTRNPWAETHVPGGSSGGAAALAAATRGMFHLGTDTGGSIRQPASYCGVTGIKPTYGRVSRYGLIAFASSLDQVGAIEATPRGCALALRHMAGWDPRDATSSREPVPDYEAEIRKGVRGLRIGVPEEYFPPGIDAEVVESVRRAIEVFRGLGVEVRDVSLPHTRTANPAYVIVSAAEASSNLARYDGVHYGHRAERPAGIVDLYARSRAEGFGPEVKRRILVGTFVLSAGYADAFYKKACRVRRRIREDFERVFRTVDAVLCPTAPVPAFRIGERVDDPLKLYAVDVLTVPANLASVPGISFPCGLTAAGLPIGVQVYGRPFEEGTILRLAHAFSEETGFSSKAPRVCAWSQGGRGT